MKDIKLFIIMARLAPRAFGLNLVAIFLLSVFETLSVFSVAIIVDLYKELPLNEMTGVTQTYSSFLEVLGLRASLFNGFSFFIITIILKNIFLGLSRYLTLQIKYVINKTIMLDSFEKYFAAKWSFFAVQSPGKVLNTLNKELGQVADSMGNLGNLLRDLVKLSFLGVSLFFISWKLAFMTILVFVVIYLPSILLGKRSYKYGTLSTQTANKLQHEIKESLDNAKTIMSNSLATKVLSRLAKTFDDHVVVTIKGQLVQPFINLVYEPVIVFSILGIVYIGNTKLNYNTTELIMFLYALKTIYPLFVNILIVVNRFKNVLPSYIQIKELESLADQHRVTNGSFKLEKFSNEIEFKNVSFTYPGRDFSLSGLNFKIPKGKTIALVGRSGSGKSTVVDLLLKNYEVQSGKILIDGKSLNEIETHSFRKSVGLVLQGNDLFNMSIRENLLLANDSASEQDIKNSLKESYCTEFIEKLPEGIDTLVGEKGAGLSGGQRQRICIAMALIRRPHLLILDEATSALDMESEQKISLAIESLSASSTVLTIAHRLSTIKNADQILVFVNGKIIETGNYEELMKNQSFFYELAHSNEFEQE
jgi:subfamily B ATP-binding cassette protein MsbA